MEILLSLGDTLNRGGDVPGARSRSWRRRRSQMSLGASRELALAALGIGGRLPWARPGRESKLIPLLQDALVHLGGADDRLRVRLLARLACALRSSPDQRGGPTRSVFRPSSWHARSTIQASLSYALAGRFWATWWPRQSRRSAGAGREMRGSPSSLADARAPDRRPAHALAQPHRARRHDRRPPRVGGDAAPGGRSPSTGPAWLGIAPRALMGLMEGDFSRRGAIDRGGDRRVPHLRARPRVFGSIPPVPYAAGAGPPGRGRDRGARLRRGVSVYPLHRAALAICWLSWDGPTRLRPWFRNSVATSSPCLSG